MRAFVAILPPREVREALSRAARSLPVIGVRWVRPENIHLTLKFLGEVPEDLIPRMSAALSEVARLEHPFRIEPEGFGAFPSPERARVLWAGIGEGSERLEELAAAVEEALSPLGFERERRPFRAHLTLGRARGRPTRLETVEPDREIPGFTAGALHLMRSAQGPSGVYYESLLEHPFSER
ncbi:RNA 2',3'-cyclic phosphodiesterase [Rubrobacter xylanophilus]|uniref:RNA 2',3'-cyclic phosphodiesterase n=1 Tax=Rubrobacter xylanophilus TaxID=49319 RepID=A0A510HKW6_9ACTN|nr:RNA 2',3'-cyclic phosphodiesterase [Rubrobacter xylanophilus]BBL80660.1 RNA 2',3'-cyclic phosphodiesterase [Rubrobacter xylanophilus]